MAPQRNVVIAGAGIGGLTAALALTRSGFRVTLLEASPVLEEVGAGLQLSPNATNVLLALGLGAALKPHVVAPERLCVANAASGDTIVEGELGLAAAVRYRAPFWVIHRADLQRVLADAARVAGVDLHLGVRVEEFAAMGDRVVVVGKGRTARLQYEADALVGADGIWSVVREKLGSTAPPRFRGKTAWRTLIPAAVAPAFAREAVTTLWLGPHIHVVHYPLRGGADVNVVAIIHEDWAERSWNIPGDASVLQGRTARLAGPLRALIAAGANWSKWALHELAPLPQWGAGRATLLGDAAHAVQPFLAQGAALSIEDAAVLARHLAAGSDIPAALRAYEAERRPRAAQVQAESARNGVRYGWRGPWAFARNWALKRMGGEKLIARYDWVYDWKNEK